MFRRKIWQDRQVEHPNRRLIKDTNTGDTISADITRNEGNVITPGDMLNAANMNDLERRIEAGINSGGGSGSTVEVIPTVSTGTKIANIVVDGVSNELYAPNSGGGGDIDIEVNPSDPATLSMEKLRVDGVTYNIELAGLADVDANPSDNEVLSWDANNSCWVSKQLSLESLTSDTTINDAGCIAIFNTSTQTWEPDTEISNLSDGQALVWDDNQGTWVNSNLSLNSLTELDPTQQSYSAGDIIYYNSYDDAWAATTFGSDPVQGDLLAWDSGNMCWRPTQFEDTPEGGNILIWESDDNGGGSWVVAAPELNTLTNVEVTDETGDGSYLEFFVRGLVGEQPTHQWRNSKFTVYGMVCDSALSSWPQEVYANTPTTIMSFTFTPEYYWYGAIISSRFNIDLSLDVDPSQVPSGGEYHNFTYTLDFYLEYDDSDGSHSDKIASEVPVNTPVFISDTYNSGSSYTIPYSTSVQFVHNVPVVPVPETPIDYTWRVELTCDSDCNVLSGQCTLQNITERKTEDFYPPR